MTSARPGPAKKSPPTPTPTPTTPSPPPRWKWLVPAGVVVALMALLLFRPGGGGTPAQALTYSGFVADVSAGKVSTAAITAAGGGGGERETPRRQGLHLPDPDRA